MDMEDQLIDSFSTPDDISDVTLIVEDKKIFAHKSILGKVLLLKLFYKIYMKCEFFSENFSCI